MGNSSILCHKKSSRVQPLATRGTPTSADRSPDVTTPALQDAARESVCWTQPGSDPDCMMTLSIGAQVLQKYDVKAVIGKGSFSKVLRVENRVTRQTNALKMVDKRALDRSRYETELRVLGQVRHPNIVTLYEIFQTNTKVYLIMELASGGDLFDRIYQKGRFTEKSGKSVLRMLLSAIAYIHSNGIVHRDLKLENVLYKCPTEDSPVLISDFGLAYIHPGDGKPTSPMYMLTTCGSPEYLAPEMLEGETYTELIDMWALGVVAYTVLSGSMPFVEESRAKLYARIRAGNYSFPDELWSPVSAVAKDFIRQLLSVDTATRLSATRAAEHRWMRESARR
ncbi:hypothetical protein EMCRGX_G031913 [Ephydatia muelleri]